MIINVIVVVVAPADFVLGALWRTLYNLCFLTCIVELLFELPKILTIVQSVL